MTTKNQIWAVSTNKQKWVEIEEFLSTLPVSDAKYIREIMREGDVSEELMLEMEKIERREKDKALRRLFWDIRWMKFKFDIDNFWWSAQDKIEDNISHGGDTVINWLTRKSNPDQEVKKFSIHEFNELFVLGIVITGILLVSTESLSRLWPPLGIILYGIDVIFFLIVIVLGYLGISYASDWNTEEINIAASIAASIGIILAFSQLCRYSFLSWGGFNATSSNYWYWLRYSIANFLEAGLFDIPAIYEWQITNVQATANWSRGYLFIFRTILEFIVVASILTYAKEFRRKWETSGILEPTSYLGFILLHSKQFLFASIWLVLLSYIVGIFDVTQVEPINLWTNIKLFLLPTVGFGLFLTHIKALKLHGKINKLVGILGMMLGIWVIYKSLFS